MEILVGSSMFQDTKKIFLCVFVCLIFQNGAEDGNGILWTQNLPWYLLSIYFVSGTVLSTFFAFSQRLSPALEIQRFGLKSHQAMHLLKPFFLISEMSHTLVLPEVNFESYKHINIRA